MGKIYFLREKNSWEKSIFLVEEINYFSREKKIYWARKNWFSGREKINYLRKIIWFSQKKKDFPKNLKIWSKKQTKKKENSLKKPDGPQPYLSPTYTWGDAAEDRGFPNVIFIWTVYWPAIVLSIHMAVVWWWFKHLKGSVFCSSVRHIFYP